MLNKRILFVGMHNSIHVARWVDMAGATGASLHMFPVFAASPNESLHSVTLYQPTGLPDDWKPQSSWSHGRKALRLGPLSSTVIESGSELSLQPIYPGLEELGGVSVLESGEYRLGESANAAPLMYGPGVLASVIRHFRPHLIHSLEFQHAAYLVLKAKELYKGRFPPWLATNWGSDIYYYKRFEDHRKQIERVLKNISMYSCECERDVREARDLGYEGPALPVMPNSGGFDLEWAQQQRSPGPTSARKLIMVKGYEHFAGRALTSLRVLERFADRLRSYEIVLFSISEAPYQKAQDLIRRGILNIKMIGYAPHEEILEHFGRARLYLGVSISDAISTSALEAMAMGAFPLQTNTSCCEEWFTDGETGFLFPPDDFEQICEKFERALDDDELVDRAAHLNWETIKSRLAKDEVQAKVRSFYDIAFQAA
jgi:glycosyltransferase involved in cell wall biosynthesis